jgi:hypothetical protein
MVRYLALWSFIAVLAVLVVGTVVGVAEVLRLHRASLVPFVIVAAVALGIVYIVAFARPFSEPESPPPEPAAPSPPTSASDAPVSPAPPPEPFVMEPYEPDFDPVEEADRLASARPPAEPPASGDQDSQ